MTENQIVAVMDLPVSTVYVPSQEQEVAIDTNVAVIQEDSLEAEVRADPTSVEVSLEADADVGWGQDVEGCQ